MKENPTSANSNWQNSLEMLRFKHEQTHEIVHASCLNVNGSKKLKFIKLSFVVWQKDFLVAL